MSRFDDIAAGLAGGALGVAAYDLESRRSWTYDADRRFHAASTIKIAVMAAVYDAIDRGRFTPDSRVHVRNYFRSAVDGQPYRMQASRDADADVYDAIGRTLQIAPLVRHMIASSSNLATNLLLDLVGLDEARAALETRGVAGIVLRRGVEDERAFQAGLSNEVTANGLVTLLRVVHDGTGYTPASARAMIDALLEQRFAGAIGPGLPETVRAVARVAHKTGDISTVSHDAGVVFLPGRAPYVIALLAEHGADADARVAAITAASRAVYDDIAAASESRAS
jgi:beta-lactamase class A